MKLRLYLLMAIALLLAFAGSGAATDNPTGPAATIASAISTRVNSNTVAAGSSATATVICPDGTVAVGGGIDVDNVLTMQISSSSPLYRDDPFGRRLLYQTDGVGPAPIGWYGTAVNTAGSSQAFNVAAVCADMAEVSTMVTSDIVGSDNFNQEYALCPEGTVALGGGIDLENGLSMEVSSSSPLFPNGAEGKRMLDQADGAGPAPIGWYGATVNNLDSTQSFKVAAICADLAEVSTIIGSQTILAGSFGGPRVHCPDGTVALSGGIDLTNIYYMAVTSSAAVFPGSERLIERDRGFGPAPVAWQGTAINDADVDYLLKVAAICAPEPDLIFLPIVVR